MNKLMYCLLILLATTACKERFISPVVSPPTGYLVVEGVVNSGRGATTIKLSRTSALDNPQVQYENNAEVRLEGDDNSVVTLIGRGLGQYKADSLALKNNVKYKLTIRTSNGGAYASDFVAPKNNPPIDSANWVYNTEGVQFFVNTHDDENKTRYYLWDYEETWEFHGAYKSYIKYDTIVLPNGQKGYKAVYRNPRDGSSFDSTQYFCWQTAKSNTILLGSTVKLTKDVVNLPLVLVSKASVKMSVLYSILVRQYSLTPEAYAFLEIMKKNTEQTGSIFDAQPSALKGNIRNLKNPDEPVIGYLIICPIQEKRVFVKNEDLLRWGYNPGCGEKEYLNNSDTIKDRALDLVPTRVVPSPVPFPIIPSFYAARYDCMNCKLNGTNDKPSFWPW
jgi:Domain of unknown function (DUF4249)